MISIEAKEIIKGLKRDKWGNIELTTTQIRKFLAGINGVHNRILAYQGTGKIDGDQLPKEIIDELEYIKIRLIYQSGRESKVKDFMRIADLERRIDEIGSSKKKFEDFNRFVEGIVAYHKFEGGK